MADNHFAAMPNISIPRSRFKQGFDHATTLMHGDLVPIDCFEVLPGDTFSLDLSSIVWMSTPIAPLFGNIKMYFKAFFVPTRLVWSHFEQFMGANKTNAGYQTTTYTIPQRSILTDGIGYNAVSHYLGKRVCSANTNATALANTLVSVLKERGYYLIWNEWYRAQQIQNPVIIDFGDTGNIGTLNGSSKTFNSTPMKVNKEFDYFTAATLYPQYGPAVQIPMGNYQAPVGFTPSASNVLTVDKNIGYSSGISLTAGQFKQARYDYSFEPVFADLKDITGTINQLRYAFAVQKYLERANFGSRFFEILNVHYGVTSPDSRLQIPERLGSTSMDIVINSVLSTAGSANDASTKVGVPGAVSCSTMANKRLFTKAFVEPGYIYILASTHHMRSYSQGILREDSKKERFEFYTPEFCNLGDQAVIEKEIFVDAVSATNGNCNRVFGYQEHWAEYRYRPNRVSGLLDPNSGYYLGPWTLTDLYSNAPTLSSTWLEENRDELARCLVSGTTGPDYVADFYFNYTATREMPLFTIPGLVDHFGVH